jgi:glycosyltransferase involved in cell wall biosynthesis
VIVVDDCSTDNSLEVIQQLIGEDPRVNMYSNEANKGCGYTKRKCAELATGELMAFVDPDDALEHHALESMVQALVKNSDYVLAFSKHYRCDENLTPLTEQRETKKVNTEDPYYFNQGAVVSHLCVFKSAVYNSTEGIDPYMLRAVDQDLYLKMFEQGPTLFVDQYLYKYRIHNSGISTGADNANVTKANYWHWYAINAAAKRRGVIVEDLFLKQFVNKNAYDYLQKTFNLIVNSGSYKLASKLSGFKNRLKGKSGK